MKNVLLKDTFREIKKSLGRFISIFVITALGVSFYTGVKSASPDMQITADKYYDDNNLMDIYLVSNLGLTDDDAEAIKNIEGVEGVFPTYSKDVLMKVGNSEVVTRLNGLPTKEIKDDNPNYINRPTLVEGRLPEKSGECVIENQGVMGLTIGSKIKFYGANEEDLSGSLKYTEYTVVGKVKSPYYISYDKGSSSIGNGVVGTYAMIPQEDFNIEAYTEMYATVKGAKNFNSYDDEYKNAILPKKKEVEKLGEYRANLRYDEIVNSAKEKLEEGKKQLQEKKEEAEGKLREAEEKIKESEAKLLRGESELSTAKKNFKIATEDAEKKISEGEKQLLAKEKELNSKYDEFNANKATAEQKFKEAEEEIKKGEELITQIEKGIDKFKKELEQGNINEEIKKQLEEKIKELEGILEQAKGRVEGSKAELASKKQEFYNGENSLIKGIESISLGKEELIKQRNNLALGKKEAETKFANSQGEIDAGKRELEKGKEEYNKNKEEVEKQLKKAENDIEDGELDIANIHKGQWYVLDREANYSFMEFGNSTSSIEAIAKIFPLIFFLVAALICLTTMTRMVEEQRVNIGTMKALGYNKFSIVLKYLVYSALASIGGSIVGSSIGYILFPKIIFSAYATAYVLPELILKLNMTSVITATIAVVSITILSALIACYKELIETPALLMRPKAPKEGKRILLERIPFIWNRMSFIKKVTSRNIFRYKKRFLMTVIGIAGCSALILIGFGLKDSISAVVSNQYENVYKYNGTVNYKREIASESENEALDYISKDNRISGALNIKSKNINVWKDENKKSATLLVPEKSEELSEFIKLRDRRKGNEYNLSEEGVIITEKLSKVLELGVGDEIYLENDDKERKAIKITAIAENYIGHYVYITPKNYEAIFGEAPKFNQMLINTTEQNKEFEENLTKDLSNLRNISSIHFNTHMKNTFGDMMTSLNYVVLVLIFAAGALAFVVLYNLTNVNISERIREIATIKVLGFYDNEVSAYVFRENIILTAIGALAGLGLGVLLHKFIIVTAEMENLMFGRTMNFMSYVYATIMTIVFGMIVNWFMYYKLKKVQMVESLKSVD